MFVIKHLNVFVSISKSRKTFIDQQVTEAALNMLLIDYRFLQFLIFKEIRELSVLKRTL